jgi:hypothetical protein
MAKLVEDVRVEVLERADDPSKDLTGSIRHTGTITCIARERDGGPDYHRWIAVELNESFTDEHMRGTRVIGAVPGTPAAEAQAVVVTSDARRSVGVVNEPHGLPLETHRKIANHVADGDLETAIVVAQNAGVLPQAAREYVEGMSEYQSYLSEHGEKGGRTLRMYPSDGFAPPESVTFLEYMDYDPEKHTCRFIRRIPGSLRWAWVRDAQDDDFEDAALWPPLGGTYREVLS